MIPKTNREKIKYAAVVAAISGTLNLIVTTLAVLQIVNIGIGAENYIDVALTFGLAFGIFKKSRTCALLMLLYFVISKISVFLEFNSIGNIGISGLFLYYFIQGVIGTFNYHKTGELGKKTLPSNESLSEDNKWQCPICDEYNHFEMNRCSCGYVEE